MSWSSSWLVWALLSAAFAALTAIFAKVGVENINSDLATFIRTGVVIVALGASAPNWLGIALIAAGAVLVAYR